MVIERGHGGYMKSFLKTMVCMVLLSMVSVTMPMGQDDGGLLLRLLRQHDQSLRAQQRQANEGLAAPFWKKVTGLIAFLQNMESIHGAYNMMNSLWSGEKQKKENPWSQKPDEGFFSYLARVSEKGHRLLNGFDDGYEQLCSLYDRGCSLLGKKPKKQDNLQGKTPVAAY